MTELATAKATFVARSGCVACKSIEHAVLDSGKYCDDPVRGFIDSDPWGESPLPYLQDNVWEFVQCNSCGQAYQKWLLTAEWQDIRFSKWMSEEAIRRFEVEHGINLPPVQFRKCSDFTKHVLRIERLTRGLRGNEAVRILDFGCGWGEFLVIARQFGFDAFGVDRAPDRQEVCAKNGLHVFPGLAKAKAEVKNGFHAVTLFQVLEHIDEPLELLHAIRELMLPGSILVLEVPNCKGVTGINLKADYYKIHPLEHINCFTPVSLHNIALRAGFKRIAPPTAYLAAGSVKMLRGVAKGMLQQFKKPTTNQYFRCSPSP